MTKAVPTLADIPPLLKAEILAEALPYIRKFANKVVVVKYGGNALAGATESDALALFAEDIVLMRLVGLKPVVVHGGGPQISDLMTRLGKTTEFRNGLRVTDAETVDIARMVLSGQVNPQIVAAINVHGRFAVGVSGDTSERDEYCAITAIIAAGFQSEPETPDDNWRDSSLSGPPVKA